MCVYTVLVVLYASSTGGYERLLSSEGDLERIHVFNILPSSMINKSVGF